MVLGARDWKWLSGTGDWKWLCAARDWKRLKSSPDLQFHVLIELDAPTIAFFWKNCTLHCISRKNADCDSHLQHILFTWDLIVHETENGSVLHETENGSVLHETENGSVVHETENA